MARTLGPTATTSLQMQRLFTLAAVAGIRSPVFVLRSPSDGFRTRTRSAVIRTDWAASVASTARIFGLSIGVKDTAGSGGGCGLDRATGRADLLGQRQRVEDGLAAVVVVEEDVDRIGAPREFDDPAGPFLEPLAPVRL